MPQQRNDLTQLVADHAFLRATGAPLVMGNVLHVLRDAQENYPAWEAAIAEARLSIELEMYIIADDRTGRHFIELLAERARAGVCVRLLYDWLGCLRATWAGRFRPLTAAGVEVRASNRPRLSEPAASLSRDHRKLLVVDGQIAFVSGLCLGNAWLGDPAHGKPPWRDTGVRIRGPAVAAAQAIFEETWRQSGDAPAETADEDASATVQPTGSVAVRVVGTSPAAGNLYRQDLLVAALARETLWLTDAYFMGPSAYREALRNAARDGVDVRLLVPRSSDLPWIATVSRTLYRPLLEAGVRVFEWNGPMIHAKTAVADGRWARVGSSNLNLASLLGNWEIDVTVENADVAETLEEHFLQDLRQSTEILMGRRQRVVLSHPRRRIRLPLRAAARSARGAVRYAALLGDTVGAAVGGHRPLDATEAGALAGVGLFLLANAAVAWFYPQLLAIPVAIISAWTGFSLLYKAAWLKRRNHRAGGQ
ncbi:cardiolipin synthase B [Methylolobus aquaticus]|nr:cardiolipin synthase B [Methylolobus aquaticus]